MANPGTFSDLGKQASVILFVDKDFNDKDQLNWTSTSSDGVKNITKITREDGRLSGSVEFKLPKYAPYGMESSFTFDTKGKLKGQVSSAEKLVPGLKVTLASEVIIPVEPSKDDKPAVQTQNLQLSAEYKRPHFTLHSKYTVPLHSSGLNFDDSSVVTSIVIGSLQSNYSVAAGVEANYALSKNLFKELKAVFQYSTAGFVATAYSKHGEDKKKEGKNSYLRFNLLY